MDILTQGLLGGVVAQSVASHREKKIATISGFVSGLLADADILIRSAEDPLLNIEFHRHFTHSIIFIPLGACIALLILWPFMRKHISIAHNYIFCLAGFSMSGVLDACTSYGTMLFWPFSQERIALNIISIIDPVFTLCLVIAIISGLIYKHRLIGLAGLGFCFAYLVLGYVQLQRANEIAQDLINKRNHTPLQHVVKPTIGNLVLWRSVYMTDKNIYVDAVRAGIFSDNLTYAGSSLEKLDLEKDLPGLQHSSVLYGDISRFSRFSNGFVAFDPGQDHVIGDIRYSMLPNSVSPLWGIVINPENQEQHAAYEFFRRSSAEIREKFLHMLLGK